MAITETPVLLIVFNRPDKVQQLITSLEKIRPAHVFIAADGPRSERQGDTERCREVRDLVGTLPWPCTITTNFQEKNLGCRMGVSTAISWFFTQVTEGIILEDDCIPSPEFFTFTTAMLNKYRDDASVMHISGTTFITRSEMTHPEHSYWFSHTALVWGWATWRRAWAQYDLPMSHLDDPSTKDLAHKAFKNKIFSYFWLDLFAHIRNKKVDTWDVQWVYSILRSQGVSVVPAANLIRNIGFDTDATHTTKVVDHALTHQALDTTLTHPSTQEVDHKAEQVLMRAAFLKSWRTRARYTLRAYFSFV